MLSHDRHASIKLWGLDHSSHFDYGVRGTRPHEVSEYGESVYKHKLDQSTAVGPLMHGNSARTATSIGGRADR